MMAKDLKFVKECIEKYRSKLLDTSKRNNLVSFNHSERSRQHIRVIDELPDFLYGEFLDGKTLTFLALPEEEKTPPDEKTPQFRRRLEQAKLTDEIYIEAIDSIDEDEEGALDEIKQIERDLKDKIRDELDLPVWQGQKSLTNAEVAKKHDLNPSYEMPDPTPESQEDKSHHTDKYIQTLLKPEEMLRKLGGLHSYIRSDIEESGVNTLYAAFGFLQWYESKNTDKACVSPLLLLQLEVEKKQSKKGYTYSIQATGEEPEINLSLSERLKNDFGIQMPEFTGEDGPESYMDKVTELINGTEVPKKDKWRVRRFLTIGRFRFARLVMFHDLNEKRWSGDTSISSNGIIQDIFSGSDETSSGDHADDYDIDTPEVEEIVPLLITSADASQHSALVDVMKGQNLAIKGPPGTGKSQTITNIIACALAKGKTVLFMAEKMAALNVVYDRLSKANLGPYCLELHSTKAKKTEVIKSLDDRLKLRSSTSNLAYLDSKQQEFKRHRDKITEYVDALNTKLGRQGKTAHDYLWSAQLRKDRVGDLMHALSKLKIPFEQADLTEDELSEHIDSLKTIVILKNELDKKTEKGLHPWNFVESFNLDPFQQDEFKQLIENWKNYLEKSRKALEKFSKNFKISIVSSDGALKTFLDKTENLTHWNIDDLDNKIITKLGKKEKSESLVSFIDNVHIYRAARDDIKTLSDISYCINEINNIKKDISAAHELKVENLNLIKIGSRAKEIEGELKVWDKSLETLLNIGKSFGVSKNEDLDKIYALAEVPDYIASVPRDYLLFRTKDIIDEKNAERLKNAADIQERLSKAINEQEAQYDLSMLGEPHEIRLHAATIENPSFFAFIDSSYRQAKKLFKIISKHKIKFTAENATKAFRDIANTKEERQKIEQDTLLQSICGASFQGINTDFEKLRKINEWAKSVRERYASVDEFSNSLRQCLLTASMEELDAFRELNNDPKFLALKTKISSIKDSVPADIPVKKYLSNLAKELKSTNAIGSRLQGISNSKDSTFADVLDDMPRLEKAIDAKLSAEKDSSIRTIFGDGYAGADTDIQDIEQTVRFVKDFLAVEEMSNSFGDFLNSAFSKKWHAFIEGRQSLEDMHETTREASKSVQSLSKINITGPTDNESWATVLYSDLLPVLVKALKEPNALSQWIEFNAHLEKAKHDLKGDLISTYLDLEIGFDTLPLAFEYMIYSAIAREIYTLYPVISSSNGMGLEQARKRIKELDKEILGLQQDALCNDLKKARTLSGVGSGRKSNWTEGSLIHNEISKQRRHIPIRDLMKRAGQSIQKIKPCFLMSPLTVAQYLDPGNFTFDLVVIDEASQMRPEDALGGIARAKQIVVVGDPQQLPPTSFFQSSGKDDENEEEDFTSVAIMDMALSSFRPSRILSRHYRSEHESLIAFSNYHFYDKSLVLFPSPIKNPDELGVRLEYVGGTYAANSNMDEVQAIAKAALDFMKKYPDRSLGIATVNQVQKDLIEVEMDRAFIEHAHAAKYKAIWQNTLESFFVKNLESVQGDERDAIFISTVYGPDKNGTVMQRFGPINRAEGHRRLNVLFTRAKKNMVVFTSMKPEDIKISKSSSKGLKALKGFLSYASKGVIDEGEETHLDPDSDFEIWVKEKLESIGCEVHPQVGVAGYRIDLGVKHPKYPYGYLIGVECDGASYHSSKSARERDIIRQQVLENLGWNIYRIWSTDWFSNPVQEFEKLKSYIEGLLNSKGQKVSEAKKVVVEDKLVPEQKEEKADDLFTITANSKAKQNTNVVQLFDNVTYFMIKDGGGKEKRSVQIVPTQGDPNGGTIGQHSAIGRALIDCEEGEEVECALPIGEVTLTITKIAKSQSS